MAAARLGRSGYGEGAGLSCLGDRLAEAGNAVSILIGECHRIHHAL